MIVTIHQPEHLPYFGFFEKVCKGGVFVIMDSVQFNKRNFQHRNRILTKDGVKMIGVRIEKTGRDTAIRDVLLSEDWEKQREKNLILIEQSYKNSSYFNDHWEDFKEVYRFETNSLLILNLILLEYFFTVLGIVYVKKTLLSELRLDHLKKSDLILGVMKAVKGDVYLSGEGGKNYLVEEKFNEEGVKIVYNESSHPIYVQEFGDKFEPNLCILDLLFNYGGENLKDYLTLRKCTSDNFNTNILGKDNN